MDFKNHVAAAVHKVGLREFLCKYSSALRILDIESMLNYLVSVL
jgi:hypothetical protein